MKLENKKIIVTGGASGMGEAAVKVFAREGAKVVCIDITPVNDDKKIEGVKYIKASVANKAEITQAIDDSVAYLAPSPN